MTDLKINYLTKNKKTNMNLKEYLTQPHVKFPVVYLQHSDFKIESELPEVKFIFIAEIREQFKKQGVTGIYAARKNERNLYTVDSDGYPKSRSVFFLPLDFWE
jgi:hypothetical protein